MNYELTKKLKDAGFNQEPKNIIRFRTELGSVRGIYNFEERYDSSDGLDWVYFPTLSELIEACSGNNKSFALYHHMGRAHGWEATRGKIKSDRYLSPEEAVANLWLALNKDLSPSTE